MQQQTFKAGAAPIVVVDPVPGDLLVAGWDRSKIMVKTDSDRNDA